MKDFKNERKPYIPNYDLPYTSTYSKDAVYEFLILTPRNRCHRVIVKVDDRIPCKKGTKRPHFMKPNGNEMWALILEKAYAKHCVI